MARPVPFSLPQEIVDAARKQRESSAMSTITSDIDSTLSQGFSGLQGIAKQAAEPLEHFAQSVASGGIGVPTLEDLTPDWVKREQQRASEAVSNITTGTFGVQVPSMDDLTPQAMRRPAQQSAPVAGTTLTGPPPSGTGAQAPTPLPARLDTSSRDANLQQWAPALRAVEQRTGLRADALAAIIQAENGGGQSPLSANDNNYFSISAVGRPKQAGAGTGGRFARYATPQDSLDDFVDLVSTSPRYADAWANRNDPAKFFQGLVSGGYIVPEPGFPVETWMRNLDTGRQHFNQLAPAQPAQQGSPPPGQRQPLQGITPPQFGLGDADADAICGPVLALAFAKAHGRNPTIAEAKQMATQHGGWTSARGMGGPEAMAQTLRAMDIPAHYAPGPLDVATIRRETQNGNPVGINTPGHYLVVEAVDEQGRLDLGNSAKALRASGGRQWFTPDEIAGLGMGAPTGAIYADRPSSPTPSVAVQHTQMPTVSTPPAPVQRAPAAPSVAPAPAPAPAPRPIPFAPAPSGPPVRDDWRQSQPGISVPTLAQLHPNVSTAFLRANGREPTPDEAAELAALGYGVG